MNALHEAKLSPSLDESRGLSSTSTTFQVDSPNALPPWGNEGCRETERNGEKQRETAKQRNSETETHFQVRTVARLHVRVHRILPEKQYRLVLQI